MTIALPPLQTGEHLVSATSTDGGRLPLAVDASPTSASPDALTGDTTPPIEVSSQEWNALGFLATAAATATSPDTPTMDAADLTKRRSRTGKVVGNGEAIALPARRRKRDPALPKRATTAFVMFAAERRPSVLRENPGIMFADVGRLLGNMWAEMSPEERSPYERLVQIDRQRYEREMDTYLRDYQMRCQERLAAGHINY